MRNSKQPGKNRLHNPEEANHQAVITPFTASDIPIGDDGSIYHLQVKPGQIAPDILLVGDPGRAELIGSTFLRDLEFEHEHRGLVTVTGTVSCWAMRAGTPTSSIRRLGSGDMTVLEEKSTRFPERLRRKRPSFPFSLWDRVLSIRPDLWVDGEVPRASLLK